MQKQTLFGLVFGIQISDVIVAGHRTKIQLVFSGVFDAFAQLDDLAVGSNQLLQFAQLGILLLEVEVGVEQEGFPLQQIPYLNNMRWVAIS